MVNTENNIPSLDDPVSTPEQIIAHIIETAGGPAEHAAWDVLQDELTNLRAAKRAIHELINTLATPAVAGISVPADAMRHALQVGLGLRDDAAGPSSGDTRST